MKCKAAGCESNAAEGQVYCSRSCSPFGMMGVSAAMAAQPTSHRERRRLRENKVGRPRQIRMINFGPFELSTMPGSPGRVWIQKEDGEGMETSEVKLAALLEKFWREEF